MVVDDISQDSNNGYTDAVEMVIGNDQSNSYFNGLIDDLAIFKGVALSSSEVQQLYNNGNSLDVVSP